MKVSRLKVVLWILIAFLSIWGLVCGFKSELRFTPDYRYGSDLRWRRNEILCAHQGVNSFRIWNREITLKGFAPWWRPDFPNPIVEEGDKIVHAYPPWHACFFYFYGWLPEILCISLMSLCFGFCTKFIVDEVFNISNKISSYGNIVAGLALSMIAFPFAQTLFPMNYSILLLALFLLLRKLVNSDYQFCAGLCWAVMMIKPQVAMLLFWPLFWKKKYKTIIVAVLVCFCATCITSLLVGENPLDLIFQVPKIGEPYEGPFIVDRWLKPVFGSSVFWFWMGSFFILASILSYLTKNAQDFLVSSASTITLIPIWSYLQTVDHVMLIGWFLITAVLAQRIKCWRIYWLLAILVKIFSFSFHWTFLHFIYLLSPGYIMECQNILTLLAAIIFSWQVYKHNFFAVNNVGCQECQQQY